MKKFYILLSFVLLGTLCYGGNDRPDLNVNNIPDSLKKNAYAVVRFSTIDFEYKSATSGTEKRSIAITILNKKGNDFAEFQCHCDKFRELRNFNGKLFDAEGKFIQKYKQSDISSTEYSGALASDAKLYYYECDLPTYPVTIVYEYEINWKNGIFIFPAFFPQFGHNLSVEKSSYSLSLPEKVQYRNKAINIKENPLKTTQKGICTYKWTENGLCAIEPEKFEPDLESFVPLLYLSPESFIYDGVPGSISDWNTMGKWEYGLIAGRDVLNEDTKKKIVEMTKEAKSDKEKVHILYDYLGKTTRYVSIQLGIGGYQPMPASEVCKTGFGDCKALSNYLKSMLSVVGIPSYYTGIKSDKTDKRLFTDYANFNQMNHVILMVPLPNDTLWLECTNPRVPFGFVHNNISGHDALVDFEQGGKIIKLPDYPDSLNIEKNCALVSLNEDGSANVTMNKQCRVKMYDNYDWFPLAKSNEQADNLREDIKLPSVTIGSVKIIEDKSALPSLTINYDWTTPSYGSRTGIRLFVPANPFNSTLENLKKTKRIHDISISAGYKNFDSIFIAIPAGFEIESLPAPTKLNTEFGYFDAKIKSSDKGILITQTVLIPSGTYKAASYPDFTSFFEKISNSYRSKIILRKRTT